MNFLLVGFSRQNADALTFFLQRNYDDINCHFVERSLDSLQLVLPALSDAQKANADAFVININGVGMTSAPTTQTMQNLQEFLGSKPSMLLARNISQWRDADFLPSYTVYQNVPYSTDDMNAATKRLIDAIKMAPTLVETKKVIAAPSVAQGLSTASDIANMLGLTAEQQTDRQSLELLTLKEDTVKKTVLTNFMQQHFAQVYAVAAVRLFMNVFAVTEPFRIGVADAELLIDPEHSLVMGRDIQAFLDFCHRLKSHPELLKEVNLMPIGSDKLLALKPLLQKEGFQSHALTTFMWQVYLAIVPDRIESAGHDLQLKVRLMPNFGRMKGVPNFMHAVVSSCLVTPKSVGELKDIFEGMIDADSDLQKVFVLAALCGVADMNEIVRPPNQGVSISSSVNESVQKASKTGFFGRLLKKLSF